MERETARRLRAEGHTLAAIAELAGVSPTTVGRWCLGIVAPPGLGARDTQKGHRQARDGARQSGRWEALRLASDPLWVAGTTMYWGEGSKSHHLGLSNSDPDAMRLFVGWVQAFHDAGAAFFMKLHLHLGDDESDAIQWWCDQLDIPADVGKTFWKPPGTGHRHNVLPHGICTVRVRRSTLMLARTLGWIEGLSIALPLRRPAA